MASSATRFTVWHAFYDLLRGHGMTTMFGNPGSTEQPMLKNFPSDFQYVLGLQEASVVGMAGGFAQAVRKPVVVSLHTSAGTGNAMGVIVTAFITKVPLVIIAGQQARTMLIGEPMLANRESEMLPKPYVKWSYQPVRAADVPAAVARGIAIASQAPMGPVYISVPLDDWDVPMPYGKIIPRAVSTRVGPDPLRVQEFAERIKTSSNLALILGPEVDRSLAWDAAIAFADRMQYPVFSSPLCEREVFPATHPLWKGSAPPAQGILAKFLEPYDLVLVVGAEVFRYYPWVEGPHLVDGTSLLQITEDPNDQTKAVVGDAILSDVCLALEALNVLLKDVQRNRKSPVLTSPATAVIELDKTVGDMSARDAFAAIASMRPADAILCHETPSNTSDLLGAWKSVLPESCFTFGSGGLGWNAPAAVGVALAQKKNGSGRQTILVIGDGSIQYSIQSIYTAVQLSLKLVYLVPVNKQYAVLKQFAVLENTPGVPGLDIPGLDISAMARAYGCPAVCAQDEGELKNAFQQALNLDGPMLIEFLIGNDQRDLLDSL